MSCYSLKTHLDCFGFSGSRWWSLLLCFLQLTLARSAATAASSLESRCGAHKSKRLSPRQNRHYIKALKGMSGASK